jgi:hypothetical protein
MNPLECVVCGEILPTKDAHDKHYEECSRLNSIDVQDEEAFGLIFNENNY